MARYLREKNEPSSELGTILSLALEGVGGEADAGRLALLAAPTLVPDGAWLRLGPIDLLPVCVQLGRLSQTPAFEGLLVPWVKPLEVRLQGGLAGPATQSDRALRACQAGLLELAIVHQQAGHPDPLQERLEAARKVIFDPAAEPYGRWLVALSYVRAAGVLPVGLGLRRIEELFEPRWAPHKVSAVNRWFHLPALELIETVVQVLTRGFGEDSPEVRELVSQEEAALWRRVVRERDAMIAGAERSAGAT